jgi:arylsulfatase A-like enzyme
MRLNRTKYCLYYFCWLLPLIPVIYPNLSHAQPKPNILIILTDDQGYGEVSAYGARDLRTPHLDTLLASGMHFTNFYANSSVCSPSRAALLSGRYPEMVGVPGVIRTDPDDSWGYLAAGNYLLPAMLKKAGYHTALVGKWHLGLESPNTPNERGFDHFHGFLGDMMDDYMTHRRHAINYMRINRQVIDPTGHATDLFTDWAGEYIRQRARTRQPFFLYLAYNAPHDPIQPPAEWLARVKAREPGISEKRAGLVALIEHMDAGIGQVIQTLKETGAYDNTLIIFTSDNGGALPYEANNGPYRGSKGTMYEGGLRVPAAVVWPGRVRAGSTSTHPALVMDIYPTVLQAAGEQISHPVDGQSFLPQLLGQAQADSARSLFFIRREGGLGYMGKTIDAVRKGDWKLLQNTPFEAPELYNLREDPFETRNLAEAQPEVFRELNKLLQIRINRSGAIPWQKSNLSEGKATKKP